jgi:hypothetical protein
MADSVKVRIRVEGACAEHVPLVQQLLNRDVTAGGTVVSHHDPQPLRTQDVTGWAAGVRTSLSRLASRPLN